MRFPIRLLDKLKLRGNVRTFIETGTFKGETALEMSNIFNVHTVEINPHLAAGFRQRLKRRSINKKPITAHEGKSPVVLTKLREGGLFSRPCLFWLDAHWCGGTRFDGECPLLEELEAIGSLEEHVVVIDDARFFLNPPERPHRVEDWPSYLQIDQKLQEMALKNRHAKPVMRVVDDTIVIVPATMAALLSDLDDPATAGRITMSMFGRMGRFGNQVFQRMFLETYGRRWNLEPQTPPWVGDSLFTQKTIKLEEPGLMHFEEVTEHHRRGDSLVPHMAGVIGRDVEVRGYFQYHTSYYAPDKEFIQGLFQPLPALQSWLDRGLEVARGDWCRTLIGAHFRRGDYGRGYFYITPVQWYLNWLEENWEKLDTPGLLIASEDPAIINAFAKYKPITIDDVLTPHSDFNPKSMLGYNHERYEFAHPEKVNFYKDFYALTQCDVLMVPQSTFSFAAAMLNKRLQIAVRSELHREEFVPFDPWNDQPLRYHHNRENYPKVSGAWLDSNPAWT